MNRNQQKKHRLFWIILAILIPLGFIAAIIVLPEDAPIITIEIEE